jgi:penicillin-insensitive murein endopeptidase
MILARACLLTVMLGAVARADPPANAWSRIAAPTPGPALAIGGAAHGCLAGAARLPLDGAGYAVIRPSRRRFFGHPDTVSFVETLGRNAAAAGLPRFYVGDIAQPRGGPLPFGHASHQTGLDVDLWFTFASRAVLSPAEREEPALPSMLSPDGLAVDPARFDARQVALLKLAAADARVDRIFVNPTIKLALCRDYAGAIASGSAWLRRLSPWWGHDDHFHVRLRCPAGSPSCEPQAPVPEGDGCNPALEDWTRHQTPPQRSSPVAPRLAPAACAAVLDQR